MSHLFMNEAGLHRGAFVSVLKVQFVRFSMHQIMTIWAGGSKVDPKRWYLMNLETGMRLKINCLTNWTFESHQVGLNVYVGLL